MRRPSCESDCPGGAIKPRPSRSLPAHDYQYLSGEPPRHDFPTVIVIQRIAASTAYQGLTRRLAAPIHAAGVDLLTRSAARPPTDKAARHDWSAQGPGHNWLKGVYAALPSAGFQRRVGGRFPAGRRSVPARLHDPQSNAPSLLRQHPMRATYRRSGALLLHTGAVDHCMAPAFRLWAGAEPQQKLQIYVFDGATTPSTTTPTPRATTRQPQTSPGPDSGFPEAESA